MLEEGKAAAMFEVQDQCVFETCSPRVSKNCSFWNSPRMDPDFVKEIAELRSKDKLNDEQQEKVSISQDNS